MRLLFSRRSIFAGIALWMCSGIALAIPVQLNITQSLPGGFGLQSAATGSFSQLGPDPTVYSINNEFKFFVDAFSTPVLGSVTGYASSVIGIGTQGCSASDFAGFQAGSIALVGGGACLFSTSVNNAFAAGAIGVVVSYTDSLGSGNYGLQNQTFVPSIIATKLTVDSILAQLAIPTPVSEPQTGFLFLLGGVLILTSLRRKSVQL